MDVFQELVELIMFKFKGYMDGLELEVGKVEVEFVLVYCMFV